MTLCATPVALNLVFSHYFVSLFVHYSRNEDAWHGSAGRSSVSNTGLGCTELQGWTSEASIEPSYAFFPARESARAIEHVSTRVFVPACARESVETWALCWDEGCLPSEPPSSLSFPR